MTDEQLDELEIFYPDHEAVMALVAEVRLLRNSLATFILVGFVGGALGAMLIMASAALAWSLRQ